MLHENTSLQLHKNSTRRKLWFSLIHPIVEENRLRLFSFERSELENNVYLFWEKAKKDYYANLNKKDIADNKQFWRKVKPLLSYKTKSSEKITLVEGETIT